MDVIEVIKTTGSCRYFKPDPVPDEVLARVFDAARFGPQGGNRQPVRWIVVRDAQTKKQLKEWYLGTWNSIVGNYRAGDTADEGGVPKMVKDADHLANHFDETPVLVVVCAVMGDLLLADKDLDRPSVVGGASVFPSVQNFLLSARNEGLGACLTSLLCASEPLVKDLLGIPPELITCCTLAVGYPERPLPTKLRRAPISDIVYSERHGQQLFG